MISCLRRAGVEVVERHVPVWEGRRAQVRRRPGVGAALARARRAELLRRPSDDARRGRSSATRATSTCGARQAVARRRRSSSTRSSRSGTRSSTTAAASARQPARRARSRAIDRRALPRRRPRRRRHRRARGASSRALGARRVERRFVGAEERLFRPGWRPTGRVQCLFVGKLIPLHGLETILAAARLAPDFRFRVVGSRPARPPARRPAAERRARALGRVRAAPGRAAPRLVRARDLRHRRRRRGA